MRFPLISALCFAGQVLALKNQDSLSNLKNTFPSMKNVLEGSKEFKKHMAFAHKKAMSAKKALHVSHESTDESVTEDDFGSFDDDFWNFDDDFWNFDDDFWNFDDDFNFSYDDDFFSDDIWNNDDSDPNQHQNGMYGYVNSQYYINNYCNSTKTYSTGMGANVCFVYYGYGYQYSYKMQFDDAACSNIRVTSYIDLNCQNASYTSSLQGYQPNDCTTEDSGTYMASWTGYCSVGNKIQLTMDNATILSTYNATQHNCGGDALMYQAFATDVCLPDDENYEETSMYFTCDVVAGRATRYQYGNSECAVTNHYGPHVDSVPLGCIPSRDLPPLYDDEGFPYADDINAGDDFGSVDDDFDFFDDDFWNFDDDFWNFDDDFASLDDDFWNFDDDFWNFDDDFISLDDDFWNFDDDFWNFDDDFFPPTGDDFTEDPTTNAKTATATTKAAKGTNKSNGPSTAGTEQLKKKLNAMSPEQKKKFSEMTPEQKKKFIAMLSENKKNKPAKDPKTAAKKTSATTKHSTTKQSTIKQSTDKKSIEKKHGVVSPPAADSRRSDLKKKLTPEQLKKLREMKAKRAQNNKAADNKAANNKAADKKHHSAVSKKHSSDKKASTQQHKKSVGKRSAEKKSVGKGSVGKKSGEERGRKLMSEGQKEKIASMSAEQKKKFMAQMKKKSADKKKETDKKKQTDKKNHTDKKHAVEHKKAKSTIASDKHAKAANSHKNMEKKHHANKKNAHQKAVSVGAEKKNLRSVDRSNETTEKTDAEEKEYDDDFFASLDDDFFFSADDDFIFSDDDDFWNADDDFWNNDDDFWNNDDDFLSSDDTIPDDTFVKVECTYKAHSPQVPSHKPTEQPVITFYPTRAPSTFRPTTKGETYKPTASNAVKFAAKQTIVGISYNTYSQDPTSYNAAIQQSVAMCMTNCYPSFIQDIVVTSATGRRLTLTSGLRQLGTDSPNITVSYTVNANIPGTTYSSLTSELNTNVQNGHFANYLGENGQAQGVTGFYGVTATVPAETDTTGTNSGGTGTSSGGSSSIGGGTIAGIVIGGLAGLFIIGGLAYYFTLNMNNVNNTARPRSESVSAAKTAAAAGTDAASAPPAATTTVNNPLSKPVKGKVVVASPVEPTDNGENAVEMKMYTNPIGRKASLTTPGDGTKKVDGDATKAQDDGM